MGIVYLIGAGPGDPGLLTVRGQACLGRADVVIYDHLVNPRLLDWTKAGARQIYAGKRQGRQTLRQMTINRTMVRWAKAGKIVARLKGGDPFVFGRGGEEAEYLVSQRIPFEVIPGVTSAIAAPAYAGIPVTHRRLTSMVTIVAGHEQDHDGLAGQPVEWARIARSSTLVILMGTGHLQAIIERLQKLSWQERTPIALIRWGTCPTQETLVGTLGDIVVKAERARFQPPATIVIGQVVRLKERLSWFERRPLYGRRIVVTRAREQASELVRLLEEAGAEVIQFPMIRFAPVPSYAPLDRALRRLAEYDWVLLTSVNGVAVVAERWRRVRGSLTAWRHVQTCAIGPQTAQAIAAQGWPVARVAQTYQAEAILPELGDVQGKRILFPRAAVARDLLPQELRRQGAHVDVLPIYRTEPDGAGLAEVKPQLLGGAIDCITFTSSSTAINFLQRFTATERQRIFARTKAASIGPITSATLRAYGIRPSIEAKQATIESLVHGVILRCGIEH